MDRRRHGRSAADERARADVERRPQHAPTVEDAILDLQHSAGNRGVAAALGGGGPAVVQRQPAKRPKNDGGTLKLDAEEEIPLLSATWSLKTAIATMQTGGTKRPTIHPVNQTAGDLALKRRSDGHSRHLLELMETEHASGTLRLDRPSRDGAIPATSLDLRDVSIVSFAQGKGDDPTETVGLAVDAMKVSGMGKEEPVAPKSKGYPRSQWDMLATVSGADPLPKIPLISLEYSRHQATLGMGPNQLGGPKTLSEPFRAKVTMGAGMALTRIARAQAANQRLDVMFALAGEDQVRMAEALVESMASTSDGADVVEVGLISEVVEFVPSAKGPGGAKSTGQAGASTR